MPPTEILYANRAADVMFGYLRDELVGEPIAKLSAPIDRPPAARLAEILHSLERDGIWSGEVEQLRKDGGRVWCSVSVSAFEHPRRGTVWTSVHTDVTARRAADETLRTADERFRRLFEDSPIGIALVSAELQLIDAIPPCARSPAWTATS